MAQECCKDNISTFQPQLFLVAQGSLGESQVSDDDDDESELDNFMNKVGDA